MPKEPKSNQYILECFNAVYDEIMPKPFGDFILSGAFASDPGHDFVDQKTGELFTFSLIKDIDSRGDGIHTQLIRIKLSKRLKTHEPIAIAELKPKSGSDDFTYYFVIFPNGSALPRTEDSVKPAAENLPVYFLKYKGLASGIEIHCISESFDQFVKMMGLT